MPRVVLKENEVLMTHYVVSSVRFLATEPLLRLAKESFM